MQVGVASTVQWLPSSSSRWQVSVASFAMTAVFSALRPVPLLLLLLLRLLLLWHSDDCASSAGSVVNQRVLSQREADCAIAAVVLAGRLARLRMQAGV